MIRRQSAIVRHRMLAFFAATRRVRLAARCQRLGHSEGIQLSTDTIAAFANLPLCERLADRLADAMIAIDDAVQMCDLEGDATYEGARLGLRILAAYDQVNCIMKTISD